jgi:hypothetical protein
MTDEPSRHNDPFARPASSAGDPFARPGVAKTDPYAQLGLEPGAPMRDIEAAYWRFAAQLKGQAAMKPYTDAYQALVDRSAPRRADALPAAPEPPAAPNVPLPDAQTKPAAGSKFNWPPVI